MNNLTTEQLLFLDNLIYLNFSDALNDTDAGNGLSLINLIKYILTDLDTCTLNDPAAMTKEQWVDFLESFVYEKDEEGNFKTDSNDNKIIKEENRYFLDNYVIENYQPSSENNLGYSDEFRAACFVNKNDTTDVVAVFRGTGGAKEWKDDLMMGNNVSSDIMDEAALYINRLPEEYGNNITVTGHSKGGNKSQYVTIVTESLSKQSKTILFFRE